MLLIFALTFSLINFADGKKPGQCPPETITSPMTIESPLFEANTYPSFFRCWYNITAPENKIISVKFSTFSLPPIRTYEKINYGPVEVECLSDFLQVTMDIEQKRKTLKFCGNELENRRLISPNNEMQLLFQSMNVLGLTSLRGFSAKIEFLDEDAFTYCDTVVMALDKISDISMNPKSKCSMAVKAPIEKVPQVILSQSKQGYVQNCNVKLLLDSHVTTPNHPSEWNKQFNCKDTTQSITKNVNLVPFTLENIGNQVAKFDINFDYKNYAEMVCGGEIAMKTKTQAFDIQITTPGLYSCMWKYAVEDGSALANQKLTPSITLNELDIAGKVKDKFGEFCLANHLAMVLEDTDNANNGDVPPILCGNKTTPETWSMKTSQVRNKTTAAILFFGRVAENGKAIIRGQVSYN